MTLSAKQLTVVHLIGSLARAVGHKRLELDVKSPAEAMRAINVITRGKLEQYLRGPGKDKHYKVALQRRDNVIGIDELQHPSGRSTIYIMPTIRGRNEGWQKIAIGVVILVAAIYTGGLAAGASGWAGAGATAATATTAATGTTLSLAGTIAIGFGTSLILGGITQMITPTPKGGSAGSSADPRGSTAFAGNATTVVQGGCVPVVYGRALVTPIPISITVENTDVFTTDAGTDGSIEVDDLQGGGQQYSSITL